jgi:mannosyltransferase
LWQLFHYVTVKLELWQRCISEWFARVLLALICALRYNPKIMGLANGALSTRDELHRRTTALATNSLALAVQRILALVSLLVAWGLRFVALDRQDIWWDEARNIDVALRPFTQVAIAPELDIHPPVYFWLLHGWTRLSQVSMAMEPAQIAFVTRWLSVAAGVISVALLYQLARRASSDQLAAWSGVVASLIGAFSPFWLAESQETRMYTVGFALLLGAGVALLVAWQRGGRGPLTAFVLLSVLALLTHYNAVFILVAWYIGWGVWALFHPQRKSQLTMLSVCGVATAILVSPIVPIALRQIPVYANPNLIVPTVASYLAENWQAYWGGYAYPALADLGTANLWLWGTVGLAVIGLGMAWAGNAPKIPVGFLLLWVFGGLALYYIAVLDRGAFNVRYSSFITPPLYAVMAVAIVAWSRIWKPLAFVALVATLAIWPQAIYADLYDDRFAREDIAGVTEWLRANAGEDAVIFVDQKYPFGFYYDRYVIDSAATPVGSEAAPARYLFVDINTIDQQLQAWAAEASQVYWVQWFESDTDPRRSVAFLLDQQGERVGEKNFQGYSIDWWQLTPPNSFELAPNLASYRVSFPPLVETVEISLPDQPVTLGGNVPVVIRWQRVAGGEVTQPLKARVALYSGDGARVSQRDERLLNDRHLLPAEWSFEDHPLNVYLLDVADDLTPGHYTIGLLVYDADTLEPFGFVDEAGNPAGVEATIGAVEILSAEVVENEP